MKQTELAEKIGQTQASISNVITQSSRKPSAPALLKMAAALECSATWIITGEGHPFEVSTIGRKAEKELLAAFREMDPQAQSALLAAAHAMKK
jgi:transcriptional regulator with XRE-family HTH domain